MDYLTTFSIIALAALIHASFQLGVSMVTLLSGHAIGRSAARNRSVGLVGAFLLGTLVMTTLVISTVSYFAASQFHQQAPVFAWSVVSGMMVAVGVAVWVFYYRRGEGTPLWIPRAFARFLQKRVHTTSMSVEAFSLGLTTVIAELPFIAAPIAAVLLPKLPQT